MAALSGSEAKAPGFAGGWLLAAPERADKLFEDLPRLKGAYRPTDMDVMLEGLPDDLSQW
jgi:hypothetical protein